MECPICIEPYNSSDKKPMSLECGHSLCGPCLESLFKTKRECPIDRTKIYKPIEAIPINFGVLQIIEATSSLSNLKLSSPELPESQEPPVPMPVKLSPSDKRLTPPSESSNKYSNSGHISARVKGLLESQARVAQFRKTNETREYIVYYGSNNVKQGEFRKRNVVVKNLPIYFNEALLKDLFKEYGRIESVKVVTEEKIERDANGKIEKTKVPKGTGFVMFQSQYDAERAIQELNGVVIDDKTLFLQMWKPRSEWTKRPKQSKEPSSESTSFNSYNPDTTSFHPSYPNTNSYPYQQSQSQPISNPYSPIPSQPYNPYIHPPMNMQYTMPLYQPQSNYQAPSKQYQKRSPYNPSVYNPYHPKRY